MRSNHGLTLIEVLLALAITSIALTAIIRASSQSIQHTIYLQQRTIASWIAEDVIHQMQVRLIPPTSSNSTLHGEITMASQPWSWELTATPTAVSAIQSLHVRVSHEPDHLERAHLIGFTYAPHS